MTASPARLREDAYNRLLEIPNVGRALFRVEAATAKRDSISRKLCGGSTAVTVDDLASWEAEISAATKALEISAASYPLLNNHPFLAGARLSLQETERS